MNKSLQELIDERDQLAIELQYLASTKEKWDRMAELTKIIKKWP